MKSISEEKSIDGFKVHVYSHSGTVLINRERFEICLNHDVTSISMKQKYIL